MTRRFGLVCLPLSLAIAACGASPMPPAGAPTSAPAAKESESKSPESGPAPGGEGSDGDGLQGGYAEPPPTSLGDAERALELGAERLGSELSAGRDCDTARKSLASMERAKARICTLNGPDDPGARCKRATERVAEARERLRRGCDS